MKSYTLICLIVCLILIGEYDASKVKIKIETYRRRNSSCWQSCQMESNGRTLKKAKDKQNNRCECKFEYESGGGYNTGHNTRYNTGYNTGYPGTNTGYNTGYPGTNTGYNTGYNSRNSNTNYNNRYVW